MCQDICASGLHPFSHFHAERCTTPVFGAGDGAAGSPSGRPGTHHWSFPTVIGRDTSDLRLGRAVAADGTVPCVCHRAACGPVAQYANTIMGGAGAYGGGPGMEGRGCVARQPSLTRKEAVRRGPRQAGWRRDAQWHGKASIGDYLTVQQPPAAGYVQQLPCRSRRFRRCECKNGSLRGGRGGGRAWWWLRLPLQ